MAVDIIDHRLIGALHVCAMRRDGFDQDPTASGVVWQTSTLDAVMDGRYDGDITVGELLAHGNFGIGTLQRLDGEMLILDGECWNINSGGEVLRVAADTLTPFAVVCDFSPAHQIQLTGPLNLKSLNGALDRLSPATDIVSAVRVDGEFSELRLRSVAAQTPPYPPLLEVTAHQTEWNLSTATGTLLGFRFPDNTAGLEVPGYHLHFISDDHQHGGHVLAATLIRGSAAVDTMSEMHVELPEGIEIGQPGTGTDREAIRRVEGG